MSRRVLIGTIAGAVVLAGALAAALTLATGSKKPSSAVGAAAVAQMFHGIPQQGPILGRADAPVTLVEFADPQCPYCGEWAKVALPVIVSRYVRTGKVRIVFNGLTFVGSDSEKALRAALAAGRQHRFWNVIELLYENQGTENTGWVSDSFLHRIGSSIPGLDVKRMLSESSLGSVTSQIGQAAALANQAGVDATPTFAVGKTGGTLQVVQLRSFKASGIEPSLDAALAS
ncbi:MAG TPA: thioredoxin domain-containing protein [Gaiellaceae bacterium]|nr:thioredoxin domain-containing protein [Gaiellaceae bacterium]